MITAVGFDLDGTLFDHDGAARAGLRSAVEHWGGRYSSEVQQVWDTSASRHFERWRCGLIDFDEQRRERLRDFLPVIGAEVPSTHDGLDDLFESYKRAYRDAWAVFDDVIGLLGGLRSAGYSVGLLTNGDEDQQLDKLAVTGLGSHLDAVCVSGGIGVQKPDPAAFGILADRLGAPASQVLFVGDSQEHDVDGALGAGMKALFVDRAGEHSSGITEALTEALAAG